MHKIQERTCHPTSEGILLSSGSGQANQIVLISFVPNAVLVTVEEVGAAFGMHHPCTKEGEISFARRRKGMEASSLKESGVCKNEKSWVR